MPPRPYRRLFADRLLRGLAVADACARLPQGMLSITLLLVTAERTSMTAAGLAVARYALGQGVTGPLRGPAGGPARAGPGRRCLLRRILAGAARA